MEGKQRLLQLLAFTNGPAIDVVQQYFELKIIRQGSDFEDYLNDPQNKHRLFHERYPKIPCCECIRTTSIAAPAKRGCLGYQQFSKLYDENGNVTAGHEQTNRSQISQHCICKVSAQKSIKVIDIDLTLLNAIIQHCCNLHITTKIAPWMKVIKEVRDTISHLSEGKLEKNLFEQTWKKLKNATLQCAGDIGHTSVKIFQMTIDLITTCSVDDLEKRMLQTTNKLSEVHKDLNGIIPAVQSILSKQNELCDQLCSNSKDLTEVKTLCSGVNTVMVSASVNQERTNDEMEKLNVKTEKIEEDVGDIKHMLQQIKFMCAMKLKPPGENLEEYGKGEKNRKLTLDVDVTSAAWDEKRTTCKLEDEMQATRKRVDNVQLDDNTTFVIEKVENKCIYLELSASPEVFQSPQRLRTAIKSLIRQFVQAGELDENVPATVNINIIVNSALTTEEKTVVYTVFSDNDTLDGSDDDEKLQFEQKPRFIVKEPTIEPDQQIASTSAIKTCIKGREEQIMYVERDIWSNLTHRLRITYFDVNNHKPLEDFYSKIFHSTRIIENNISAKTKEILQTDCRTKELATTSESCRQKMKKCAKELIQIKAQIKKLHSDANDLQSKETSLRQELSSLDVEIKKEKELHQQQTSELDLYKSALEKESAILEELEKKQTLEEEKKIQLHQEKQREYENRRHALEIENKKQSQQKKEIQNRISRAIEISHYPLIEGACPGDDEDKTAKMVSRYESHISREESKQKEVEAAQVVPQCASSEEAGARSLSPEVNIDPMILVMAAEENKDELESFKADVLLAVPQSVTRSSIQEIVFESNITGEFLRTTDNQIQKAVLLFILVSGGFANRYWPDINKMKNLTAALYDQQPLVVPVIIKANVKPPVGLHSAQSLKFYRRNSYYKEALSKLLGRLKK